MYLKKKNDYYISIYLKKNLYLYNLYFNEKYY